MSRRRSSAGTHCRPGRPQRVRDAGWDDDQAWISIVPAWCAVENLEEAKGRTHDLVIETLGPWRRGGVRWAVHTQTTAHRVMDQMATSSDQADRATVARIRSLMDAHGGLLVIAMAPGVRPEDRT